MASNRQIRIQLEKRGINAENLNKYQLNNSQQLIERQKEDRYLEQHGMLEYQGGSSRPPQQQLTTQPQPGMITGTTDKFIDPVTGKQYFSPGIQYSVPTQGGVQVRESHNTIWLNGNPADRNKLLTGTGAPTFATVDNVKNGSAGWSDVESTEREKILSDPNFYKNGLITQYPVAVRDQILNDPNFNWKQLPKWQKTYYSILSNPKIMASPMALAGAHAGGVFGIPGKIAGAAIGYGLGVVGGQEYDPTRGVFDQPTATAGLMAVLNKLSEGAEQTVGYTAQLADAAIAGAQGNQQAAVAAEKMVSDPAYRKATWEAGRFAYEASDFLGSRNWIPGIARLLGDETAVLAKGGQDFVIGSATPIDRARAQGFNPVTGNFYDVTDSMGILQEARLTIHKAILNGEDPRDVVRQIMGEQSQYVGATVSDFAGQAAIDPLEYLPEVTAKTTSKLAALAGNETAARAFSEAKAPVEGIRRYQTLVQTGDVAPGFDYSKMSSLSRMFAGINEAGQIKAGPLTSTGLLDKPAKQAGLWSKLREDWAALTPESRAREGANMFYNNLGVLLSTFDDPHEISKFMSTLSKGDMQVWAEMGNKIAQSPEWYTILPALKDFEQAKIDGPLAAWDLAQPHRERLLAIADVLGEEPGTFIEDLAKRGTAEQDFQRVTERLQQSTDPGAKDLLDDIQRGEFTRDNLKQIVDVFTGEGALPWHPDQWKASLMDALGSHFDEWAVEKLGLGKDTPESKAFFRTTHLLKSAQSVLLLGGSPGYALQNGMSNMVHRAATGIYGYMTPGQIDSWLERFGVTPARLEEGVGIGGEVEQAASKSSVKTEAIQKAIKGNQNDALGRAQRIVSAIGRGMPFNKLSSAFEQLEGKNGYMIAMRDMWSQTWRRGHGFAEVTPELKGHLERAGINPNSLYALIEAGMSKDEIERFVYERQSGIMSRTLVNDAAQKIGIPSTQAARLLEKVGVLDELDRLLTKADTPDKVRGAFSRAISKANDYQSMQTARDLKAMAEAVTNKVQTEGAPAALDVVQRVNGEYFDAWLDHYSRFGETFEELRNIPDPVMRDRAIDLNYAISDQEFRRINARTAANYQGIFEAWGKSRNPTAMEMLAAIAQADAAMRGAYDFMRTERRSFFDRLRDNPDSIPAGEWEASQKKIDAEFERAFKSKHNAEVRMGEQLGKIHEEMYGPAAGEAARKWWEDYTEFSDDIVKREKKFRQEIAHLDRDAREAAKQKYYSTEKVAQIAELERINQEGIKRLERVIKNGKGGQTGTPTGPRPGTPPPSPGEATRTNGGQAEEINDLIAEAEKRQAAETKAKAERVTSIWDAAEEFNRVGLPYDRTILQDRFALIGALRKEEYGGIPDLTGLDDPRLTPEMVRDVMSKRAEAKSVEEGNRVDLARAKAEQAARRTEGIVGPDIHDDTSILKAISEHGGLQIDQALDLTGEKRPRSMPGVFRKKGLNIDEMARMLADDGYPIDINDVTDPGGIRQTTELLDRARRGEKIYPTGHDYEAALKRAETAFAEEMAAQEPVFDMALWQKDLEDATASGDLTKMYEKIGELPEELTNETAPSGETWTQWMSRVADETAARVEEANRDQTVEDTMRRIDRETAGMEERGNAVQTKRILEEKFKDVFGLDDEQAHAYMELSDSLSEWYARTTGESGDAFYSRYYEDVIAGGEGDLFQEYYRGTNPGDTRRIRTGDDYWDSLLFVTDKAENAKWYGSSIEKIELRKDAKVLREGTREFNKIFGSQSRTESLLDWASRGTQKAEQAGYDAVHFTKQTDVGTAIINRDAVSNRSALFQIEPVNRRMSAQEVSDYARALVRSGADELRRAVVNENEKADRIAILDAAHKLNPGLAERVARGVSDQLFQEAFGQPEGITPARRADINHANNEIKKLERTKESIPSSVKFERLDGGAAKVTFENGEVQTWTPEQVQRSGIFSVEAFAQKRIEIIDKEIGYQREVIQRTIEAPSLTPLKKGAVTFDATGIRATIHAFEAKDFSTLIHENAHVFRRVLSDVATRTGNSKVLADLATIEEWAGVKDGNWTREHEEKFARGFERYITDGNAPTPKLKKAFESFKSWMLQVYKQITGSAIDVNLTDDVRAVFNRMLGEEKPIDRMIGDRRQATHQQLRDAWGKLDKSQQSEVMDWIFKKTLVDPLSGLETLVAKDIEGAKPAGWVEAVSDLNALTAINNTWGHAAGDQIIKGIGEIAKVEVEKAGGRAFRVGGDEFSYWFPNEQAARTALDAIDQQLQEKVFTIGEAKRKGFTISYGIGDNLPSADKSLYSDKTRRIELGQRSTVRDQMPPSVQTLFQTDQPMGTMEDASGFKADSEWQDAGFKQHVRPLLDAMQTVALDKMQNERPLDGAYKDMSPEGQQLLRSYINQTKNDMGAVKNSTIKWGESQRDFAMLNYNRRYGFDRGLEAVAPYQFYYTRSLMTWAARAIDKPAWYANFARIRNLQNKHERDVPERLRNKFRIPAPWLPKWMGDALYIDPLSNLFTPANFLRPFETMMRDKNYQVIEAERVLQEWAQDGNVSQDQIVQAAQTRSGSLWERAFAEAQTRRESEISNPFDFMATMFGPAWYLSTPLNLAGAEVPFLSKGDKNKVTPTPLLNTARALEATTKGTWAEPIGQFVSLLGKPEEMLRKKIGLPEFGEFGDYYVDRQLSNMVADGLITSQQAQQAMIERNGALFDQARERVKLELSMRTPLASATYALTHEGAVAGAKSFLPSLFGSGLLPAGELEYRGLKSEWNEAWKKYDGGDKTAINTFFADHPEYEAYLAKGKPPEERLKSFLIGNIWDAYMGLGPTNQKQARAEMGNDFSMSFLDKETRSYDSLDVQTLTQWAQMLGALAPRTPETAPVLDVPKAQQPKLNLFDPQLTQITDEFFKQRTKYYNNYYDLEQGYYALPKSQRASYLLKNPDLKSYWDWKKKWMTNYPDLQPIFKGQVFKRVDTTTWAPGLLDYVTTYAYSGKKLPKGAMKALEQQWIMEGRPMDNLNTWLNSTVVPAMLYGGPQQ